MVLARAVSLLAFAASLGLAVAGARAGDEPEDPRLNAGPADADPAAEPVVVDSPLEHLEAPCAKGDGAACLQAGQLWYRGQVPGQDRPNMFRAVNLYVAACAFDVAEGCVAAARMYLTMEAGMQLVLPAGTPSADLGAAAEQLRFACDKGVLSACGQMGDLFVNPAGAAPAGALFRGVEQDYFYAAQSYQAGCNEAASKRPSDVRPDGHTDARSCARLGELHERGAGVMLNASSAADYYERACRAGLTAICAQADAVRAAVADGTWVHPDTAARAERPDPGVRGDGHKGRLNPDTERFKDDSIGILDRDKEAGVRFELVGMIGSRWFYGPPRTLGGPKFKAGLTVWVKLLGFSLETGFNTDRLFIVDSRYYARYLHAFVVSGIFPLPIRLPIPATLALSIGAGPTLGHMRFETTPFFLTYGVKEHLQLVISTAQRRGARQWGAFRFEQQQSWLSLEKRLEHSSQILFLFGFTFGGVAPEYPGRRGRVQEDDITERDEPRPTLQ